MHISKLNRLTYSQHPPLYNPCITLACTHLCIMKKIKNKNRKKAVKMRDSTSFHIF